MPKRRPAPRPVLRLIPLRAPGAAKPQVRRSPGFSPRPPVHGALALSARPAPLRPPPRPRLRVVRPGERAQEDLGTVALLVTRLIVEILAGAVPLHRIGRWTSPRLYEALAQAGLALRAWGVPSVDRIRISCPAPLIAEVAVVVAYQNHVQAIALRLKRDERGHWCCTALETTVPPRS